MSGITDRADISQVLAQIRSVQSGLGSASTAESKSAEFNANAVGIPQRRGTTFQSVYSDYLSGDVARSPDETVLRIPGAAQSDFSGMIRSAIDGVNETQAKASALQRAYELGEDNVDLTQVMIQMQKATVSFEALTQVRNKIISAYQDVMNMPL